MEPSQDTLGAIAARNPAATRVFLRHHLDFCCGGQRTLAKACAQAGLDPAEIARELDAEAGRADDEARWVDRPLSEVIDHIVAHYHEGLRRDVPALIEAARRVERVHAAKPDVPAGLASLLTDFWADMEAHMAREENVLFRMIKNGVPADSLVMPIRVMGRDHDEHGENLARIRAVTHQMQAPPHACATWRALYDGLARLEVELMQHIHLETHVLFERALAAG